MLLPAAACCIAVAGDRGMGRLGLASRTVEPTARVFITPHYVLHLLCLKKGRSTINCVWFQHGISLNTPDASFP